MPKKKKSKRAPKTIEVEVCDIMVKRRNVSIPVQCECGQDFRNGGLRVWEYQDQERGATIQDDDGSLDWPDRPESGESFIQMTFECRICGKVIAEGREL